MHIFHVQRARGTRKQSQLESPWRVQRWPKGMSEAGTSLCLVEFWDNVLRAFACLELVTPNMETNET